MSDAIDRAAVRAVIADAVSWDDRKQLASIFQDDGGRFESLNDSTYDGLLAAARWGAEQAITYADHADLLVTPEHDRQVAARALREAANEVDWMRANPQDELNVEVLASLQYTNYLTGWLRALASDRIEFGGESDA